MAQRIVFSGKQQVKLESFDPGAVGPGQVRVRILCSLLSTGTETIVFNRLFDPGTHWDKWVKYPFYPGYALIGEVTEVGGGVTNLKKGQRVALRKGHGSEYVVAAEECFPVPAEIAPETAAWFALGKITSMGARAAQYVLGDSVLIIGAGPIGQMSVRWAAAAGCESITIVDTIARRLELARQGGATATIAQPIDQARDAVREANGGQLPRVVIDSTGHANVFAAALGLAASRGRVVVLGDTGTPAQQHLTGDVIIRGLSIVGAHDGHEDAAWNAARIYRLFFNLVGRGLFRLEGMNTHTFKPGQAAEAYDVASHRRAETMGILFDWR